jgi:DNA-directed RNA polymerase alpha subunit
MGSHQELNQTSIKELHLSRRTFNAIHRSGVFTVGELKELFRNNRLEKIFFIGKKSLDEISNALDEFYKKAPNPEGEEKISDSALLPTQGMVINNIDSLSVEILNIHVSTRGALIKSGIKTIGDLRNTTDGMLLSINRIGPKVLVEIQQALASIFVDPNRHIPQQSTKKEKTGFEDKKAPANWAEIVQSYFESEKENYTYVLLSRFGFRSKTFEEIAGELGVTRARVQQIQTAVEIRFLKYMRFADTAQFGTAQIGWR